MRSRRKDLQDTVSKQGVELRKGDVVLVRTGRMNVWPDFDGYLVNTPGIGLPAAKWLCEEVGAMCIAGDTIGLEVLPSEEKDVFLPVHAYMFATAGAQIIEVVDMNEIAAEKQYEFAFLGLPLKLRGATGAPMPSYAVPLRGEAVRGSGRARARPGHARPLGGALAVRHGAAPERSDHGGAGGADGHGQDQCTDEAEAPQSAARLCIGGRRDGQARDGPIGERRTVEGVLRDDARLPDGDRAVDGVRSPARSTCAPRGGVRRHRTCRP